MPFFSTALDRDDDSQFAVLPAVLEATFLMSGQMQKPRQYRGFRLHFLLVTEYVLLSFRPLDQPSINHVNTNGNGSALKNRKFCSRFPGVAVLHDDVIVFSHSPLVIVVGFLYVDGLIWCRDCLLS
jgi:hypothetical protein